MQSDPLEHLIVGLILAVAGFLIIVFHRSIKEWRDHWNSKDFPFGYGEMWTGKYSKSGLILTYTVIIAIGTVFLGFGVFQIFRAFKH